MKKALILCFLLILPGFSRAQNENELVIGNFTITRVTDGDTFRFDKLDRPARLLGIDTEETFKTPDAAQKIEEISLNWEEFYRLQKGESRFPVKTDSPLGYEAWKWAEEFVKDADYVRLEKGGDGRDVDIFDRYLVYMIVVKGGREVNYNVECVRNGYSPYFNKYGISRRFHDEFVAAQKHAQENRLGIWDPDKKKYPDYEERLVWWDKRAKQIEDFNTKYSGSENYFDLSSISDYERLASFVGKEVIVFGGIGNVMLDKFPFILRIPVRKGTDFDLVIKSENSDLVNSMDIDYLKEFYIYAKGEITQFDGRYQIILRDPSQVWME